MNTDDLRGEPIYDISYLSVDDHVIFGPNLWSFEVESVSNRANLEDDSIINIVRVHGPFSQNLIEMNNRMEIHQDLHGQIRTDTGYSIPLEYLRRVPDPIGPWGLEEKLAAMIEKKADAELSR